MIIIKKKYVIGLACAGTAAAAVALYAQTLFSLASKRDSRALSAVSGRLEKNHSELTGIYNNADGEIKSACNAMRERSLKKLYIKSFDGTRLSARWWPAENPKRIMILVHGWRGSWWRDYGYSAPYFHENGCSLLMIEQRAHGESGGKYIGFGQMERFDVQRWVDAVQRCLNKDKLPLYLCGISMGATSVLMAAGLPCGKEVNGIIADCGFTSPAEIIEMVFDKILGKGRGKGAALLADTAFRLRTGRSYGNITTISAMRKCTAPVLFVHGDADEFVPVSMTHKNYLACKSEKELIIVNGASHGMSYVVQKERYQAAVMNFFRKHDTDKG